MSVQSEPHEHHWKPARRTHAGWFTECESCTAWWSDPSPTLPVAVPPYMKIPPGVVYPADVPSNTVALPVKPGAGGDK